MATGPQDAERERLAQAAQGKADWRRFGPYLTERQWGTVREDYSASGGAWGSFPHEHARSRAYRWGEDGLLGICDDQGFLCLALALWNEKDPILKERLFGVANPEGNHGEDVKECYYYLDATPTASYLKALYKYPQAAFPYEQLVSVNRGRSKAEPEYELLDTGIFDGNRYFDVFVEYAKAAPDDILVRITAHNRGPAPAPLHVLPTLWFRNTWSWKGGIEKDIPKPAIRLAGKDGVVAQHARLGRLNLVAAAASGAVDGPRWMFTENETNVQRLYGQPNPSPYVKDGFHAAVVERRADAVRPEGGTKCAAHFRAEVPAGGSVELRLRLSPRASSPAAGLREGFDEVLAARRREADGFYAGRARPDDAGTLRQASAGMIWSKQLYYYVARDWLDGDPLFPPPPERKHGRNARWRHVYARDVISMPDKWEFPWFAAWDLAFHTLPFAFLDPDFARDQLQLMLREWYMAPSGQLAAYEYDFGDVNPPVHAWACRKLFTFGTGRAQTDVAFLRRVFPKLLMNFTWWVNRKDPAGENLFTGGFLGMDNIGIFDRNAKLPGGVRLEQSDATAWMAFFCNEMLAITVELARVDPDYGEMASTFVQHFASISEALNGPGGLWDEEAGFYHDQLRSGERRLQLEVRSLVGLMPLVGAVSIQGGGALEGVRRRLLELVDRYPWFRNQVQGPVERPDGRPTPTWLLSLVPRDRLERLFRAMFDEREFLSAHGIRSMSRIHLEHPVVVDLEGQRFEVRYLPGESDSWMFGGNSNWRGPVWMPLNAVLVEALYDYHRFYGEDLQVELPTGSGRRMNLRQAAVELATRLLGLFRADATGRRPCHGGERRYAEDPNWKDLILFNEYFHGDTGRGCGASHQTGWTGLAAVLAHLVAIERGGRG
ncbi:MAG TPA: glucosidase [Anaeromyxobacter sp.]